jgi:hypothetical protein
MPGDGRGCRRVGFFIIVVECTPRVVARKYVKRRRFMSHQRGIRRVGQRDACLKSRHGLTVSPGRCPGGGDIGRDSVRWQIGGFPVGAATVHAVRNGLRTLC